MRCSVKDHSVEGKKSIRAIAVRTPSVGTVLVVEDVRATRLGPHYAFSYLTEGEARCARQ